MSLSNEELLEQLKSVIDPEVGLNIVDMGLVYQLTQPSEGMVGIEMTLTTPGCPMSTYIKEEVGRTLTRNPEIKQVGINIVWTPRWTPDKIKPEALEELRNRRR